MATIIPAPSANYGEVIVQPGYFTSSLFVNDLREDIQNLIQSCEEQYAANTTSQPFTVFKQIWTSQGWHWFHLMVLDDRGRQAFLNTVFRLLLERMTPSEAPTTKATALFAFYTVLYTQPSGTAPSLLSVSHVPITIDHFETFQDLLPSYNDPSFQRFQATLAYIIKKLEADGVFLLTPTSDLGALNPRSLPRELYVEDSSSYNAETDVLKKKGRPSKRDKAKKARANLEKLDACLISTVMDESPQGATEEYATEKSELLEVLRSHPEYSKSRQVVDKANHVVLERMKAAESTKTKRSAPKKADAWTARLERAVNDLEREDGEWSGGALALMDGAGMSDTVGSPEQ